ncbi:hypothetical protein ARMSODRAFT_531793 [Armillaria solidipes]|uniref:Uncharacterized protein n=1 Tax=Armillaria solidipes TaxID=1076256 RepID=A0A2H3B465_9AGAR|nr:hypothetical protein ARMSODRAFT_531793 [Armillaria solidipes]
MGHLSPGRDSDAQMPCSSFIVNQFVSGPTHTYLNDENRSVLSTIKYFALLETQRCRLLRLNSMVRDTEKRTVKFISTVKCFHY